MGYVIYRDLGRGCVRKNRERYGKSTLPPRATRSSSRVHGFGSCSPGVWLPRIQAEAEAAGGGGNGVRFNGLNNWCGWRLEGGRR